MTHVLRSRPSMASIAVLAIVLESAGCGGQTTASKSQPPATISGAKKEADLSTITLTPEAEQRLGIATEVVAVREVRGEREVAGDLIAPPGRTLVVTAPVGGTVEAASGTTLAAGAAVRKGQTLVRLTPLVPLDRDLRATSEAELAAARVRLDTATRQLDRARQLVRDEAGSQRSLEQAQQEFSQAKAAHDALAARLAQLDRRPLDADVSVPVTSPIDGVLTQVQTAPGQTVASGATLVEVANLRTLWVKVPVYVGDLSAIAPAAEAAVDTLQGNARDAARRARRVIGPPSADPLAVTADVYFELDNGDAQLRPGQKVGVTLPLKSAGQGLAVPASAVVYDYQGGAWVYVAIAPHVYARERVDVIRITGADALLGRGPSPGARVVTAGAAELFGTEFGAGK